MEWQLQTLTSNIKIIPDLKRKSHLSISSLPWGLQSHSESTSIPWLLTLWWLRSSSLRAEDELRPEVKDRQHPVVNLQQFRLEEDIKSVVTFCGSV